MRKKGTLILLMVLVGMAYGQAIKRYNPTKPIFYMVPQQKAVSQELHLSMIVLSGENRYAVINGVIVQEGGSISGFTVRDIDGQTVLLESGSGVEKKLSIVKSSVKFSLKGKN